MELVDITKLAKHDTTQAENEVLQFVSLTFPLLHIMKVVINQSAVSLNSVNGTLTTVNGTRYFFKFHAEEHESNTVNEYYNTQKLVEVRLPVIQPLYESTKPGSQFLIYEHITAPTAFELFEDSEKFFPAEEQLLQQVTRTYVETLELTAAEDINDAPIFQLFYHRLVGQQPRVDLYYTDNPLFQQVADKRWLINGKQYDSTLNQIIIEAKRLLHPRYYDPVPTVIGHGDDHNGNKFYINGEFIFFDPAFAGRQPALLSFVKATAHNTFVHPDWLYNPADLVSNGLVMDWQISDSTVTVNHNWTMQEQDPSRLRELQLQEELVWKPLIAELRKRDWLPGDWQEFIRAALFCCPFLVLNLVDAERYSQDASLLALSKCIELYHYDCDY